MTEIKPQHQRSDSMSKEYTGPEEFTGEQFEIAFARAWYEYVKGGKVGVDPTLSWEMKSTTADLWLQPLVQDTTYFSDGVNYRWKPAPKRMVTIGYTNGNNKFVGKVLVAPEKEAPADGTHYYTIHAPISCSVRWDKSNGAHAEWLKDGTVFLTHKDAQAMADWLAVCRRGGAT